MTFYYLLGFKNGSKSILAGGIIGLVFLITLGLVTSDIEFEYSEPPAEVEPAEVEPAEVEPKVEPAEVEHQEGVEQVDFEPGEGLELNCNPEIDKDGDNVPDNLDVEGAIDWAHCKLDSLNLSNLELSGANLS